MIPVASVADTALARRVLPAGLSRREPPTPAAQLTAIESRHSTARRSRQLPQWRQTPTIHVFPERPGSRPSRNLAEADIDRRFLSRGGLELGKSSCRSLAIRADEALRRRAFGAFLSLLPREATVGTSLPVDVATQLSTPPSSSCCGTRMTSSTPFGAASGDRRLDGRFSSTRGFSARRKVRPCTSGGPRRWRRFQAWEAGGPTYDLPRSTRGACGSGPRPCSCSSSAAR